MARTVGRTGVGVGAGESTATVEESTSEAVARGWEGALKAMASTDVIAMEATTTAAPTAMIVGRRRRDLVLCLSIARQANQIAMEMVWIEM